MTKLLVALFVLISMLNAKEYTVMKKSCIQQSEHAGKTLDQQKEVLINQAKNLALTDLYGEMMFSKTNLVDGKISSDEIRQRAVGAVRIKGNPKFYNGSNFGEVCTDVTAYVTDKDIEKYSPKEVKLNKYCFNDPSVAMKDIKTQAKYGAYKEIISQYKPSLKLSGEQAEKLIHGFKISNDNFDFDTASYCFNAVATILPYELEMGWNFKKNKKVVNKKNQNSKFFRIQNKSTGKCIDVSGWSSMNNGTNIQSWDCETLGTPNSDQFWKITKYGQIQNKSTGKCIDVSGWSSMNNGTNIQSWDCETLGTPNSDQFWKITKYGQIQNKSTGKCIDVSGRSRMKNGTNIQSWDCEKIGTPNSDQFWNLLY
ncbi:MAG: RICIN domain-containing protein [Campylobacterota bacterium]|nr:RICIN domain-containing protein [Campylobacterota bacterium]